MRTVLDKLLSDNIREYSKEVPTFFDLLDMVSKKFTYFKIPVNYYFMMSYRVVSPNHRKTCRGNLRFWQYSDAAFRANENIHQYIAPVVPRSIQGKSAFEQINFSCWHDACFKSRHLIDNGNHQKFLT